MAAVHAREDQTGAVITELEERHSKMYSDGTQLLAGRDRLAWDKMQRIGQLRL